MGDSLVPMSTLIGFSEVKSPEQELVMEMEEVEEWIGVQERSVGSVHCDSSRNVLAIVVISS